MGVVGLYYSFVRPGTLSARISSLRPHNRCNRCRGIKVKKNAVKQHDRVFLCPIFSVYKRLSLPQKTKIWTIYYNGSPTGKTTKQASRCLKNTSATVCWCSTSGTQHRNSPPPNLNTSCANYSKAKSWQRCRPSQPPRRGR